MPGFHISRVGYIAAYRAEKKSWDAPAPRRYHYLAYQATGSYDHIFSGDCHTTTPGILLFLHREDAYTVVEREPGYAISIAFEGEADLPTQFLDCREEHRFFNLFEKLLQYQNIAVESNYFAAIAVAYEILTLLCRKQERDYITQDSAGRIRAAHAYILEHYREPGLQVTALAELAGIGAKHFTALFKTLYGTTPTQYIIDLRIRTAAELLSAGLYPVGQVAELCGFSDIYYFSKLFKKKMGCSPGRFSGEKS